MNKLIRQALALFLVMACMATLALNVGAQFNARELTLNYSGMFPSVITISGQAITIEGLSQDVDYRYIMLDFQDSRGREIYSSTVTRSRDGTATFSVSGVAAGRYSVLLYHADREYTTYHSFLSGIEIHWTGSTGTFIEAPWLNHNLSAWGSKREDLAALKYYLEPSYGIQSDSAAIVSLAAKTTAGLTSDYDKAMALHDWVSSNIYYDYDVLDGTAPRGSQSASDTLDIRRGVCQGYANLLAALLRAAGIPAKNIYGYALGYSGDDWPPDFDPNTMSNHVWNEAYIDGRWVVMDATWNSDNEWENGRITERGGLYSYRYFDISQSLFALNHAIEDYSEAEIDSYVREQARQASAFAGNVRVNGVFDLQATLYMIDGTSYVKLRDVAAMLGGVGYDLGIGWDNENQVITMETGTPYAFIGGELSGMAAKQTAAATLPTLRVSLDDVKLFLDAYTIDYSTYFKLRDLADLFGFEIGYESGTRTVLIDLMGLIGSAAD